VTLTFTGTFFQPAGTYSGNSASTVVVDPFNQVTETNENDNVSHFTVNITPLQ
jgi:subtilase family serine protease